MVTYSLGHGCGVQGPGRPNPAKPPRRAVPRRRTDAPRVAGTPADDAFRRHEAPEAARRGGPRGDQAAGPRKAALPEPHPDPARPRPVGEQVRRAMGRWAERPQERIGGT